MKKLQLILILTDIAKYGDKFAKLITETNKIKDIIKKLRSPNIDIIVWNDVNVPITENGRYLVWDKFGCVSITVLDANSKENSTIDWINKFRLNDNKITKWAKMPEYKQGDIAQ